MSLSGKLEIFPLEEVLRLLARSHQTGRLQVEGDGAGSIYLADGSLTYAATESDDALRDYLVSGGIVTQDGIAKVTTSNGTLADALAPDASTTTLSDAIREQSLESVYRIRRPQSGPFSFTVDTRPRYATGQRFDVEMIISEADRRAAEWAEIEEVVPDLSVRWRMVPTIDEESVQLSDVAWRFLAAMEGSSSVVELARRLGMTNFQAARRTAELFRANLIEVNAPIATFTPSEPAPTATTPPAPVASPTVTYDTPAETPPSPVVESPASFEPTPEPEPAADPDRGWWAQTQEEAAVTATEDVDSLTVGEVETSEEPQAAESAHDEGFLEKVFGELEGSEDAESSSDEQSTDEDDDSNDDDDDAGFGLLRRRGLGAAFRELADS